jgi:hypothetical protein
MSKETKDPRPGVRMTIYLPAETAARVEAMVWDYRISRSRLITDVITKATEPGAPPIYTHSPVPRVPPRRSAGAPPPALRPSGKKPKGR